MPAADYAGRASKFAAKSTGSQFTPSRYRQDRPASLAIWLRLPAYPIVLQFMSAIIMTCHWKTPSLTSCSFWSRPGIVAIFGNYMPRRTEFVRGDGGRIYIKDLFRTKKEPTPAQRKELNVFDRLYVYATEPVTAHVEALRKAGFRHVETATLSTLVTMDRINDAMWDNGGGRRRLSAFGRVHYRAIEGSSDRILRNSRAKRLSGSSQASFAWRKMTQ